MKTGFVILAAGAGRRMGGIAKCLLELNGKTLLERLLTHVQPLRGKARHDLVLVLGHHAHDVQAHVARLPDALAPLCVINPRPEDDTSSSLRAGLRALAHDVERVVVLLADQPLIDTADVQAALEAFDARPAGARVQVPRVHGQPGHPVVFDAHVRAALIDPLQPSLRQWRAAHPESVHLWDVDNPHYTRDLDTPQDLDALARETRWSWRWPG
ncbi:NTP transferase domain-containing protein [Hydrogenophaga sp. IBVHS1]|uniref:nucleotidyltransferase family protein n=1 Tax=unclassified Hydrogenophaga TaxID=2610897 RepID=UPI00117B56D0|nr:nucleotidyltransferase family protein [Hydrogenophaga sp. IBVHS1]